MSQLSERPLGAAEAAVPIVPWPEHQETRQLLAELRVPRLLLVPNGVEPPKLDDLEDWLRDPPDPIELHARAEAMAARAEPLAEERPELDEDGLLRFRGQWVAITPQQLPVVELLLRHLDRVVRYDAIMAVYAAVGGSAHPPTVRTLLARVAARLRPLGIELVTVRRRGVLMAVST
jgi:hypothetical protein